MKIKKIDLEKRKEIINLKEKFLITSMIKIKFENLFDRVIDHRGISPQKIKKNNSAIPLITTKIIKNGRINDFEEYISYSNYIDRSKRGFIKYGDILLTVEAPLGEVAFFDINEKVAIGQRMIALNSKNNNNKYLKYVLSERYFQNVLKSKATGSTVLGVSYKNLKNIEIIIHKDIKQQEKIALVLSKQERQIEIIETLIEKLEKRNQYYAEKLLSGEKRIRKNEQGEFEFYDNTEWQDVSLNGKIVSIPKGWEVKKMNEIIDLKKGTSIKSDLLNYTGNGVQYLRTNEVWEKSSVNKDKVYYSGNMENIDIKTEDDYILCLDGFNTEPNLGTVGLVTNNGSGICCGELHKIREIDNVSKKYVNVMLLKGKIFQELICRYAEGSTVKHAGKHFKRIENILISLEEQLILNDLFEKQLNEINLLKKINEKEKLRFQWMLDNLLSGEYQIVD